MKISIYPPECLCEIGNRSNQEDSVYPEVGQATTDSRFFIVCDGMGGHEYGEIASKTVCDTLSNYILSHWDEDYFSDDLLQEALHAAVDQINELDGDSTKRPGTTMTFLCLHRGGVTAAHIGDSRIYHIRPSERRILYKSRDHSLVYDLFMSGEISQEEMKTYKKKNVLTRAIISNMDVEPRADIVHITNIRSNDYFILCTDGLLENISDKDLINLISEETSDDEKRKKLRYFTRNNADNHSAYIIKIGAIEAEQNDKQLINDEETFKNNELRFAIEKKYNYKDRIISKLKEWLSIF